MTIRTRFSPSPTGYIHLGNARAALFSALFATRNQGTFILRIEDTDVLRSDEKYTQSLQDDLHWLGINWQEGPGLDGRYGPYWQSQRQAIYQKYYAILTEKKEIYPCFCTDQELLLARKMQLAQGNAPRYAGTCRKLSPEDLERKLSNGMKPAWRFIVPKDAEIRFTDVVKGPQQFYGRDIGDFIIRRADGTPPFLFCNAIDDATMQVSHVLRGEDHLTNTPRQILLLQALQLPVPQYGHLSLIVGDDGAPLSKRHGSFSLSELRKQGYLPLAILNYLARLGHTSESQDLLPFTSLAIHFNLEKLSRSPARFDLNQLMFWQKMAVLSLQSEDLWRWLGESIQRQIPEKKRLLFIDTIKANILFPRDAEAWAKIFFQEHLHISPEELAILKAAGEQFFVEAELAVDRFGIDLNNVMAEMKQTLGLSGKRLFMPLRVSLTGLTHGPELAQIAALLGPSKLKLRLGQAFRLIGNGEANAKNL